MQTHAVTSTHDVCFIRRSTDEYACVGIAVDSSVPDRQAAYQVINAQLLELQHDRAQVGSKDLWVGLLLQVLFEGALGVQPEALTGLSTPSTACSLMSTCLHTRSMASSAR